MDTVIKAGATDPTAKAQISQSSEEKYTPPVLRHAFQMFGKPPPFSRRQWRVFGIVATAGFFDNYDRVLLSLTLKQIQKGLGIAEARLGAMLSTIRLGYLLSLMITPFADVFGRRRLLLYTIVGYTFFTGVSAIAPRQAYFVTCQIRAFAGAEGTIALVILIEEVEAGVRGWAVGYLGALTAVGGGLAAGVFAFVNVIPFGWRGLFAVALLPLVLIIPLRRALPESQRFEREKLFGGRPTNVLQPLTALFRSYPGRLSMMISMAFLANMGATSTGAFLPKYLQEAHHWAPGQVIVSVHLRWRPWNSRQYRCRPDERSLWTPQDGWHIVPVPRPGVRNVGVYEQQQLGDPVLDFAALLRYRIEHYHKRL